MKPVDDILTNIRTWMWQIHRVHTRTAKVLRTRCQCGTAYYWVVYPPAPTQYMLPSRRCPHSGPHFVEGAPTMKELYEQLWLWIHELDEPLANVRDLSMALSFLSEWAGALIGYPMLQSKNIRHSFQYTRAALPVMLWASQWAIKLLEGQPVMVFCVSPLLIAYDVRKINDWRYCIIPWPLAGGQVTHGHMRTCTIDDANIPRRITAANRRLATVLARQILRTEVRDIIGC